MVCNTDFTEGFAISIKQRCGIHAKGRLSWGFKELFEQDNLYFSAAAHANEMAEKMGAGIVAADYVLSSEVESNQIFAVLPDAVIASLSEVYSFHAWGRCNENSAIIRLVTSSATAEEVDKFLGMLASL